MIQIFRILSTRQARESRKYIDRIFWNVRYTVNVFRDWSRCRSEIKAHAIIFQPLSTISPFALSSIYRRGWTRSDGRQSSVFVNGHPKVLLDWIHFDSFMDSDKPRTFVSDLAAIVHVRPSFLSYNEMVVR